jgi:4-amino-4-deoxy-L-arabinose transferase-like glycosyltransferase
VLLVAVLAVLVRLLAIDEGLLGKHGWRQADTAMMARNYYQNGFNFFYPQIDWAGSHPGYVGTEFPLVPFLASILYLGGGPSLGLARLVSVLFFAASVFFFYKLLDDSLGPKVALWSTALYACSPLSLYYSRAVMPESAMLCLSIAAIFWFSRWLRNERGLDYGLSCFVAVLACLVKAPAAIIAIPMGRLAFEKWGHKIWTDLRLWAMVFAVVVTSVAWYAHAWSTAVAHPPFEMFGETPWGLSRLLTPFHEPWKIWPFALQSFALILSPVGLVLAFAGFYWNRGSSTRLLEFWGLGLLLTLLLAFDGHARHEYYQLPFVPVAAGWAGCALTRLEDRLSSPQLWFGLFVLVVLPSLLLGATRYRSDYDQTLYVAGLQAREVLPDDALVVVWDEGNPVGLFAMERKGWNFPRLVRSARGQEREDFQSEDLPLMVEDLRKRGATHFVGPLRVEPDVLSFWERMKRRLLGRPKDWFFHRESNFGIWLDQNYSVVSQTPRIVIYDLRQEDENKR